MFFFFFSSRRRHTRCSRDWSSDVCSSDLLVLIAFLVYSAVGGARDMLIVLLSIPVACSGGGSALFLTGTHLSIAAALGFVSIFRLALPGPSSSGTYSPGMWLAGGPPGEGA